MQNPSLDEVIHALSNLNYQDTDVPLSGLLAGEPQISSAEGGAKVVLDFSVPIATQAEQIAQTIHTECEYVAEVLVGTLVPSREALNFGARISGVKNIIAVASGKGGVGKSTTSVNLALALAKEGASVGLLDADIYGPSQPHMTSIEGQRPQVCGNQRIQPISTMGIQCVSMGNLVTEKTPMVWRGPMASGALQQLLMNTDWDDLDYLIIDMPPGTGDIPLTLSQKVPVSGAVIVTTPQNIALLDAKKGIEMFRKVNIPVFGVVENMAIHICSNCGHQEPIFGEGGGDELAGQYDVELLAALPLRKSIREQTDAGKPPVAAGPNSDISLIYRKLARKVAVAVAESASASGPEISITD